MVDLLLRNWAYIVLGLVALNFFVSMFKLIPNNRVGIKEVRLNLSGKKLEKGIIALNGEAGFQPQLLRGGFNFLVPFLETAHIVPLVTIPQGKIGYVFARDGAGLSPQETLATNPPGTSFEDVEGFLRNGGQKGPQRQVLREGTYAINLAQFIVLTEDQVYALRMNYDEDQRLQQAAEDIARRGGFHPVIITDNEMGVVTVHDGPALPVGENVAEIVGQDVTNDSTFHNSFQDPEAFMRAGGHRGRQKQTLGEGTYFINRLFATVEVVPKPSVEVGTWGAWWRRSVVAS